MSKEMDVFPLLQSQLDIFRAWKTHPESTAYNLPAVLPFPKSFGAERLCRALQLLVASRPELCTRFVENNDGRPRQYVPMPKGNHPEPVVVSRRQLSEAEAQAYMKKGFVRPFNLLDGSPLFRFEVVETPLFNYLLLDIHHSIADGYTLARNLIGRDLPAAYTACGVRPPLSVLPSPQTLTLRDAVESETVSFGTPAYERARAFFHERFKGVDFLRFGQFTPHERGEAVVAIASVPKQEVDGWCHAHRVSVAHLFLAAFSLVVARLKRQPRVAFFCLNHGRTDRKLYGAYGMFVRSVPVLIDVPPDQTLCDYLLSVSRQMFSSLRHGVYPASHFCRDMRVAPAVTFAFQGTQINEELLVEGTRIVGRQLPHGQVRNDLGCLVYGKNDFYEIRTDSSSALNSESTLTMVAQAVQTVVLAMMQMEDGTVLSDISLVTSSEQERLVQLGRGERLTYDHRLTVCDLILQQARLTPQALAVTDERGEYTYAQLDMLSATLARELKAQGLRPGQLVCLLSDARRHFLVWVLAVWRVGGAYVPIDATQPAVRISRQIERSGAQLLLSDRLWNDNPAMQRSVTLSLDSTHLFIYRVPLSSKAPLSSSPPVPPKGGEGSPKAKEASPTGGGLVGATLSPQGELEGAGLPPRGVGRACSPAYMIFTSGSAGEPKGVVIPNGALLNLVHFVAKHWHLSSESRICCHSSFAFDASVEDMFPVLTVGGSLHLVPAAARRDIARLHRFLCDQRITGGCFTTRLGLLLSDYAPLPLDYICLGGERLTRRPSTSARVLNTYGPTECTVDATWCELPETARDDEPIPIGRPLDNMQAYVVDPHGQLLPQGAVGELWLAGPQLALGYLQQPLLTSERFVESKFGASRIYRTGDLVRWGGDGQLYFVGRNDHQIKLNGYRVELGEVERALCGVEGVKEAVVVARQEHGLLCAYYRADKAVDDRQLGKALADELPLYMVPHRFVRVEQWPVLVSGKIDVSRLPYPLTSSESEEQHPLMEQHCHTDAERTMCSLFAQVLQLPAVSPTDNFFQLGGTSLTAMQLVVEAERRGLSIAYGDVYHNPTPRQLLSKAPLSSTLKGGSPAQTIPPVGFTPFRGDRGAPSAAMLSPQGESEGAVISLVLTGATGLLGSHLLFEMLLHGQSEICCLVRSKNGIPGTERLVQTMIEYFGDVWPANLEPLSEVLARSVTVVEGDLTRADVFEALAEKTVAKVVHSAADVRHFASDNALVAANVDGTRRVVEFCLLKGCPLVHVSTVSVLLGRGNDYVRTKVAAEQLVLRAVNEQRLEAQIVRIGNLMPRLADGRYLPDAENNALLASLRLLGEMKVYPEWMNGVRIDFTPVDVAAKALLAASEKQAATSIFTISHPSLYGVGAMLQRFAGCKPIGDALFMQRFTALPDSRRKVALYTFLSVLNSVCPHSIQSPPLIPPGGEALFVWPQLTDDYILKLFSEGRL